MCAHEKMIQMYALGLFAILFQQNRAVWLAVKLALWLDV